MDERFMTIAKAHEFMGKVLAIVEKELVGFGCVRTYQERMRGVVWTEGIMVDTDYEEGQGTFVNTRSISISLRCEGGKRMFVRYEEQENRYFTSMPFMGTAEEAAAYLLEKFRACFDEEET